MRLQTQLATATTPLIEGSSIEWAFPTALQIWSLPYNAILLQGTEPHTVASFASPEQVMVDRRSRALRFGTFPVIDISSKGRFDYRRLQDPAETIFGPASVESEYAAEGWTDGTQSHWVNRAIACVYDLQQPAGARGCVRFRYVAHTPGRQIEIRVCRDGREVLKQETDLSAGWNAFAHAPEFRSAEFQAAPGRYRVELKTAEPGTVAGPRDPRVISFLVIGVQIRVRSSGDRNIR